MGGTELTSVCLAVAGLVLVASAVIQMARRTIHVAAGNDLLARLAEKREVPQVLRVCATMPGTYFDVVAAAARATGATAQQSFDDAGKHAAERWRHVADRGLTGMVLALGAAVLAWHAELLLWGVWIIAALSVVCGVYFVLRRNAVGDAVARARTDVLPLIVSALAPEPAVPEPIAQPATGVVAARPDALALMTQKKLPFARPPGVKPTLRDGECPLCDHPKVRTLSRDPRFVTYVCAGCGYAQEFADLAKL